MQQRAHGGDQGVQVELDGPALGIAELDPGDVEQIRDHVEQGATGGPHRAHHVLLLAVQARAAQHVGHADDRMQRRAQLMAHGREEAALGDVRLLGARQGVGQLGQQGRGVGRQQQESDPKAGRERRLAAPVVGHRDHHPEAHQAQRRRHAQIASAIAKAHAQRDPQIEGIEDRRGLVPAQQHQGQRQHVEQHADVAADRLRPWIIEQVC